MTHQPTLLEDFARAVVPIAIVGAALAAYFIWGHQPPAQTGSPPPPEAIGVFAREVLHFSEPIEIRVDGVAQPHRHVSVASEVSGRVKYKNPKCNDGQFVAGGTLLYEIDPADYESTLSRIQEELLQAENAIKEWEVDRENAVEQWELAERDLNFATKDAERLRDLQRRQAASEIEVERGLRSEVAARLALQNLKNQVRALDARKARAESSLELQRIALQQAQRNLDRTKILAPVDCVIVTDDCEEGGYVQAGKVVAIINDVSKGEVGCQLELDDLFWLWKARSAYETTDSDLKPGQIYDIPPIPVWVEFPFHDRLCRWSGTVSRFGGTGIDLSTRTIPCRVIVDDPTHSDVLTLDGQPADDIVPPPLATGMFVSVRIPIQPRTELVVVPANAVRSGGVVWLIREGQLQIQPIKIARRTQDRVLIHVEAEGVQAGDRVIVSPLAVAEQGMAVREETAPENTESANNSSPSSAATNPPMGEPPVGEPPAKEPAAGETTLSEFSPAGLPTRVHLLQENQSGKFDLIETRAVAQSPVVRVAE